MSRLLGFEDVDIDEKYHSLIEKCATEHDVTIQLLREIAGGRSGAKVFQVLVDDHQCILKLDRVRKDNYDSLSEGKKHSQAKEAYSNEIANHIVELHLPPITKSKRQALFYKIAGESFHNIRPLANFSAWETMAKLLNCLCTSLLEDWIEGEQQNRFKTVDPEELLEEVLHSTSMRSSDNVLHELYELWQQDGFSCGDVVFPNPLYYYYNRHLWKNFRTVQIVQGRLHGDLNLGNILVETPLIKESKYFIIDLAGYRSEAAYFYDILYLELQYMIKYCSLSDESGEQEILYQIAHTANCIMPSGESELAKLIREVRNGIDVKLNEGFTGYNGNQDDIWISYHAAGTVAGLNLCLISALDMRVKSFALAYASGHLKGLSQLLDLPVPSEAKKLTAITAQDIRATAQDSWEFLMDQNSHFASDYLHIAIIDEVPASLYSNDLRGFGSIPWSCVIDFNPDSDSDGLYQLSQEILKQQGRRSVRLLNWDDSLEEFSPNATYWYGARGISRRGYSRIEAMTFNEWRTKSRRLDNFLSSIANSTSLPIRIYIFGDGTQFIDQTRVIADLAFGDRTEQFAVTQNKSLSQLDNITSIEISLVEFASLANLFLSDEQPDAECVLLPGYKKGKVRVSNEALVDLEEALELVHCNIGLATNGVRDQSDFYKGHQITWYELAVNTDIPREKGRRLVRKVRESLESRKTVIYELLHQAGAGGTTLAKRLAWEIHDEFPTIVINGTSAVVVDKIKHIAALTEHSLLIVIESSANNISIESIKRLRYTLEKENVHAVILSVRRSFSIPDPQLLDEHQIFLPENLTTKDSRDFRDQYIQLVSDSDKRNKLLHLHTNENIRTPFLYGLTAFEDEYVNLTKYVDSHIPNSQEAKTLIMFLAIAHYYGQLSLPSSWFSHLLGKPSKNKLGLTDLPDECRAIVVVDAQVEQEPKWRPMHQLISREIMLSIGGIDKSTLPNILPNWCIMFIKYCAEVDELYGNQNSVIDSTLRQLFIDRDNSNFSDFSNRFSRLVSAIDSTVGKKVIFESLVKSFPSNAHFRAHLGRFVWHYEKDYQVAIEHIEKAMQLASRENEREDHLLFHMLGMAYRQWAYDFMKQNEERASRNQAIDTHTSESITDSLDKAFDAFEKSRSLAPDEAYGYVSAIQGYIRFVEYGFTVSKATSYPEFLKAKGNHQYTISMQKAESLLETLKQIVEDGDDEYIHSCQNSLSGFYGDYSTVLQDWYSMLERKQGDPTSIRRSITFAYLGRSLYDWDNLSQKNLTQITELMEENLLFDSDSPENIRLWFNAYRRLIRLTNIDTAIQNLATWAVKSKWSYEAYYYLYILHAVKAINGAYTSTNQSLRALESLKDRLPFRRNPSFSYEWLGTGDGLMQIISRSRLGEWNHGIEFFSNPQPLARVEGTVVTLDPSKPQAGWIELDCKLRVFFVPSRTQRLRRNDRVTLHIGFSYIGLRGWQVKKAY